MRKDRSNKGKRNALLITALLMIAALCACSRSGDQAAIKDSGLEGVLHEILEDVPAEDADAAQAAGESKEEQGPAENTGAKDSGNAISESSPSGKDAELSGGIETSTNPSKDSAKSDTAGKTGSKQEFASKIIKEELTPAELQSMVQKALPGVVCWGDSITYGYLSGGPNYPDTLRKKIDTELIAPIREASGIDSIEAPPVYNFGVSAETTAEIAGRAGGDPYLIGEDVVIPKEVLSVPVKLTSKNGEEIRPMKEVTPLRNGTAYNFGAEYYTIDGIKGKLERYYDTAQDRSFYRFTRLAAGAEKRVYKGTPLISEVSDGRYLGCICVVLMGANGGYQDDFGEDLASQFRSIVNPYGRYLCIGMSKERSYTYSGDLNPAYEPALRRAFGDRFVSIQELLNGGNNPETTIPAYLLRPDQLHYTDEGYEEIGNRVYERLDALGYFDELKELAKRF